MWPVQSSACMCPHLASPLWVVLAGSIVQIAASGHWKFHDRFQRSVSVISTTTRVSWQATNAAVCLEHERHWRWGLRHVAAGTCSLHFFQIVRLSLHTTCAPQHRLMYHGEFLMGGRPHDADAAAASGAASGGL